VTGAPVAAFAAFDVDAVDVSPSPKTVSVFDGVTRGFCAACGSPLVAWYEYLPGQVYVSVGLFEGADALAPKGHAHYGEKISWVCLQDDLPKSTGSARARLRDAQ